MGLGSFCFLPPTRMPGMVIDGADTVDLNAALVEHTSF